jgi:hypothetical protein
VTEADTNQARALHTMMIVRPAIIEHWLIRGDPRLEWLEHGLGEWLSRRAASGPAWPLCLGCQHEFSDDVEPPAAFLFAEINVQQDGPPKQVILTGVCDTCSEREDAELLRVAVEQLRPRLDGFRFEGQIAEGGDEQAH